MMRGTYSDIDERTAAVQTFQVGGLKGPRAPVLLAQAHPISMG